MYNQKLRSRIMAAMTDPLLLLADQIVRNDKMDSGNIQARFNEDKIFGSIPDPIKIKLINYMRDVERTL